MFYHPSIYCKSLNGFGPVGSDTNSSVSLMARFSREKQGFEVLCGGNEVSRYLFPTKAFESIDDYSGVSNNSKRAHAKYQVLCVRRLSCHLEKK